MDKCKLTFDKATYKSNFKLDDKINIRKLDFYYLDYVELWRG
jgi:hypothetical protein